MGRGRPIGPVRASAGRDLPCRPARPRRGRSGIHGQDDGHVHADRLHGRVHRLPHTPRPTRHRPTGGLHTHTRAPADSGTHARRVPDPHHPVAPAAGLRRRHPDPARLVAGHTAGIGRRTRDHRAGRADRDEPVLAARRDPAHDRRAHRRRARMVRARVLLADAARADHQRHHPQRDRRRRRRRMVRARPRLPGHGRHPRGHRHARAQRAERHRRNPTEKTPHGKKTSCSSPSTT